MSVDYRAGLAWGYYISEEELYDARNIISEEMCDEMWELDDLFCLDYVSGAGNYILGVINEECYAGGGASIDDFSEPTEEVKKELKETYDRFFLKTCGEQDPGFYLYCQIY